MSKKRMTIFGVGPWFVLLSGVYTVAALALRRTDPAFYAIPQAIPRAAQVGLGALLLAVGIPFFLWSLVILKRGFPQGKLFVDGPYATCRHPVYGCWVVFNVPGMVLLVGTWLGLLVPVLMYVTLRLLVRHEEKWLEDTFGDAYRTYRAKTPAVFPLLRRIRKNSR
jgi:protein-S-isoprenylcysteine O-methyltransferase Ste14